MRQLSHNLTGFLTVFVLMLGVRSAAAAGEQIARLEPPTGAEWFGFSTATDGEYVVVGDLKFDHTISQAGGAAIVYRRDGNEWVLDAMLVPETSYPELQLYGYSVAIDQDIIVVGAYYDLSVCNPVRDCHMGSANVFRRERGSWVFETKLLPAGMPEQIRFGTNVSLSDGRAVVSANSDGINEGEITGAHYIFRREGTSWVEEARLAPSDVSDGSAERFPASAQAIDGQRLLIGATTSDNAGAAYVFRRIGTTWTEEAKLMPPDGAVADQFGRLFGSSVDLSGDVAVVSGYLSNAFVYRRSGGAWSFDGTLSNLDLTPNDEGHVTLVKTDGHNVLVTNGRSSFLNPDASTFGIYQHDGSGWTRVAVLEPTDSLIVPIGADPTAIKGGLVTIGAGLLGEMVDSNGFYDSSSSSVYIFGAPVDPVPAVTTWGVVVMALMLVTAATWIVRGRISVG